MNTDRNASYDPTLDWVESLQRAEGETANFNQLWKGISELATQTYGWQEPRGYKGEAAVFTFNSSPIDQLYIWALKDRKNFPLASESMPNEVLSMQFRYRDNNAVLPEADQAIELNGYQARATPNERDGRKHLYLYTIVKEWPTSQGLIERTAAVTNACIAGIQMFAGLTGIQLPSVKSN